MSPKWCSFQWTSFFIKNKSTSKLLSGRWVFFAGILPEFKIFHTVIAQNFGVGRFIKGKTLVFSCLHISQNKQLFHLHIYVRVHELDKRNWYLWRQMETASWKVHQTRADFFPNTNLFVEIFRTWPAPANYVHPGQLQHSVGNLIVSNLVTAKNASWNSKLYNHELHILAEKELIVFCTSFPST